MSQEEMREARSTAVSESAGCPPPLGLHASLLRSLLRHAQRGRPAAVRCLDASLPDWRERFPEAEEF